MNIVFIINDPYANNIETLYAELSAEPENIITVVVCDRVGHSFSPAVPALEIAAVLADKGIPHIIYCADFDIEALKPDYIFTSNPYDIYIDDKLSSDKLSAIGRLIHVSYGAALIHWSGDYRVLAENPYLERASMVFTESAQLYRDRINFIPVGYLKLDSYAYYGRQFTRFDRKAIAWKPRWTGADRVNFISYAQSLFDVVKKNNLILNLIAHPLLFVSLSQEEGMEEGINLLNLMKNDECVRFVLGADFLDDVLGSDILVSDISSTMAEFMFTEKPVIFTGGMADLNKVGEAVMSACYKISDGDALKKKIESLLEGKDPLMSNRRGVYNWLFDGHEKVSVATRIKNILKDGLGD